MTAPLFIYFHGFLSSPGTRKAALLTEYLRAQQLEIDLRVPALPDKPAAALQAATASIEAAQKEGRTSIGLLGSSMGGFYATILAQQFVLRTVLINPAVSPQRLIAGYLGPLRNPYTGVEFELNDADVAELQRINPTLQRAELFWLLAQTGDEVLDYREAMNFYAACQQTIEPGGDHQFQHFERYLPEVVKFLQCAPVNAR
ncbi:MAG: putative esterase [Verrucomicrobiaceae bacterium]|nr:putative esterase [Verrucomicrobiaceae bacterium]